jgi:uncharacterized cofD-like protein
MKNIVTIGGGSGHAQVLKGIKALPDIAITAIRLRPSVRASAQATSAIEAADHCIICPGDLYSSITPVLLPIGMKRSLQRTNARITVVLNIMTKRGETDGYCAEDFIREIESKMGRPCDVILYNDAPIPKRSLILYRLEHKLRLSSKKLKHDPRLVRISGIHVDANGRVYHDPRAVRDALQKIFKGETNEKKKKGCIPA